jgi:hypothetical protein
MRTRAECLLAKETISFLPPRLPVTVLTWKLLFTDFGRTLVVVCRFCPSPLPSTFILSLDSLTMKSADIFTKPVIAIPEGRIKGLTRQDEADMAEQGKRQRFNVSAPVAKCKN